MENSKIPSDELVSDIKDAINYLSGSLKYPELLDAVDELHSRLKKLEQPAEAAQPVGQHAGKFFAYSDDAGFDLFDTAEEAKKAAQDSIDEYRHEAGDGWGYEVENVCWGVVLGDTKEVPIADSEGNSTDWAGDKYVDYVLADCQQPASAQPVAVPDERAAFEAWLQEGIDGTDTVRPAAETVEAYFAVWEARAALGATQPVAVPEGWQLVPKEPTRAMLDAAHTNFSKDIEIDPLLKTSYRAMLSAAQKPEGGE